MPVKITYLATKQVSDLGDNAAALPNVAPASSQGSPANDPDAQTSPVDDQPVASTSNAAPPEPKPLQEEQQAAYTVGYCKPPSTHQFKPGQSGNPKGRPPGSKNFKTYFAEELGKKLPVTIEGKVVKLPAVQVLAKKLVKDGLSGKFKDTEKLASYAAQFDFESDSIKSKSSLSEDDQAIIANHNDWLLKMSQDGASPPNTDDPLEADSDPDVDPDDEDN